MFATLFIAMIFGVIGFYVAAIWTIVYGFTGFPGALVAGTKGEGEYNPRWWVGFFISFFCMLYAQVAFIIFVIGIAVQIMSMGYYHWPIWIAAFCTSVAPIMIAGQDQAGRQDQPLKLADVVNLFATWLVPIFFFVLLYVPAVLKLWVWVPLSAQLVHKF